MLNIKNIPVKKLKFHQTQLIDLTQTSIKISAYTIILNSGGNKAIKK